LEDHLIGTALLARRFAAPFGGGDVAYWLGALHDVGKAACGWQEKLERVAGTKQTVGIDHKVLGTRIARERGLGAFANAVFGHHGGLIDTHDLGSCIKERLSKYREHVVSAERSLVRLLPDLPESLGGLVPDSWRDQLVGEMAVRLCYSALVDADSLDTAAHFQQLPQPRVRADVDFGRLYKLFEQRRAAELAGQAGHRWPRCGRRCTPTVSLPRSTHPESSG
jgi:CRISPR-associated endonuclease/helicase Cas3